jgi:hypothetical protein
MNKIHPPHSGRNRDEVADNRDESTDKDRYRTMPVEETFRHLKIMKIEKNVPSESNHEWFTTVVARRV